MHRAHELIATLKPDSAEYKDAMMAVKFDLGDIAEVDDMACLSRNEFFKLPAPLCLFQVTQEMDTHMFLAKETVAGGAFDVVRFGILAGHGRWEESALKVVMLDDGHYYCTDRHTGERLDPAALKYDVSGETCPSEESYSFEAIRRICLALEVFLCSNVIQVEQHPGKMTNRRRIEKGKIPFFTYRTLHVTGDAAPRGDDEVQGTHASPRLHFRRGHIRKLADGRRTWVRSCLVGDKTKGFSGHDYKVRMRPNAGIEPARPD